MSLLVQSVLWMNISHTARTVPPDIIPTPPTPLLFPITIAHNLLSTITITLYPLPGYVVSFEGELQGH